MNDLFIGLGHSDQAPYFFKLLANSIQPCTLRRLSLKYLTSRYHYLSKFLQTCQNSLRSLELECITLKDPDSFQHWIIRFLRREMHLEDLRIAYFNEGANGLHFDNVHRERPVSNPMPRGMFSEWEWVMKPSDPDHELKLSPSEGDNIRYWLGVVLTTQVHDWAWMHHV
ncbi:hypothetical protein K491DRAFT_690146 [Lophiostoma macrostomum CBS 122681]|uniref:Uncharacterized protein n=1 Tax=Lophiostoma macrostomum CBS 122681 TaxID=1314788 RepID=A0A6A6THK3_9PLEO|nr:hypothetical protein K491DRAFT_690146 [Lophiostoma macrostomum CBS 122681]